MTTLRIYDLKISIKNENAYHNFLRFCATTITRSYELFTLEDFEVGERQIGTSNTKQGHITYQCAMKENTQF